MSGQRRHLVTLVEIYQRWERECGIFWLVFAEDFRKDKITMETKNINLELSNLRTQQNNVKQAIQIYIMKKGNEQGDNLENKPI